MPQVAIPGPARNSSLACRHSTHGKLYASEQEKGANTTRERSYHKIFPKQPQLNHLEVLTRLLGNPKKKACCTRNRPFVMKEAEFTRSCANAWKNLAKPRFHSLRHDGTSPQGLSPFVPWLRWSDTRSLRDPDAGCRLYSVSDMSV